MTWSSPCSYCSWCTVAPTSRCGSRPTVAALAALRDGGYVGRDDAASLTAAYRFLRAAEHRLQLRQLRRTHLLPADVTRRSGAGSPAPLGFRPDRRGDARAVSNRADAASPARSAACTRSCSTGRCSRRWPACPRRSCG